MCCIYALSLQFWYTSYLRSRYIFCYNIDFAYIFRHRNIYHNFLLMRNLDTCLKTNNQWINYHKSTSQIAMPKINLASGNEEESWKYEKDVSRITVNFCFSLWFLYMEMKLPSCQVQVQINLDYNWHVSLEKERRKINGIRTLNP